MKCLEKRGEYCASRDAEQAAGHPKRQANPGAVNGEDNYGRKQSQLRRLKYPKNETETKERHGKSGQRTQKCGARCVAPQSIGAKRSCCLHNAAQEAGKNAEMPGELRVVRLLVS